MKKQLLASLFLSCLIFFFLPQKVHAQCSGGVLDGNIVPTTVTQTQPVSAAGLYYTFSATAGVIYQFSFCPADGGSASYDTQLTIIDDATSAYAGGYNDDWCGLQSFLQWTCPTTGVYRVLVTQFYCNTVGGSPATLAYVMVPPPNDNCSGATSVTDPSITVGTTAFATPDLAPSCVTTDTSSNGLWYYVVGDGNKMTASLCGSSFDTRLRVFSGSCSGLVCEGGNEDFCGLQSEVTWCSVSGTTYYMLVYGNDTANGSFTLTMSETTVTPPSIAQSGSSYCGSGSIQLDASGDTAYTWSPPGGLNTTTGPTVIASPAFTTTYTVTVIDTATGCPSSNTATVTVYTVPVVGATATNTTVCTGSPTTLTASGASTYNWQPGNIPGSPVTVNPTTATTYTVTGTSSDGCTDTATITINTNPLPNVFATSSAPDVCVGSFVTLMANGAVSYNWMPGSNTNTNYNVTPSSNTTYTLTGTDANGCVNTDTLLMYVNPLPTITATASLDTVCTGNTDTLTASGAVSYAWSSGGTAAQEIVSPSTMTTYTVSGTDTNGCVNTATVTVHALLSGPVTATAAYPVVCSGSLEVLSASGASNYSWQPGNLTGSPVNINPTTTTTYTVTGSTSNGCIKTDSVTVNVNPLPAVAASTSPDSVCSGATATLTATGANTYTWSPGNISGSSVTVTPTASTTYTATGTDSNGCSDTGLVALNVLPSPNVTASSNPPASCSGSPVTITATGASTFTWQPGNLTGSSVVVTPSGPTTYTVTGVNANGCTDTYLINISVTPGPDIICYAAQTNVCTNDMNVLLYGIPAGGTWSGPGVSGGYFVPSTAGTGTHVLTYSYTDPNGCTNSGTTTIVVSQCVGVNEFSGLGGVSFYPNPNDGLFTIHVASGNIHEMKMEVVDLQGRIIHSEILSGIDAGFSKEINLSGIANGAYYLRISSENNTLTEKLIIQQ